MIIMFVNGAKIIIIIVDALRTNYITCNNSKCVKSQNRILLQIEYYNKSNLIKNRILLKSNIATNRILLNIEYCYKSNIVTNQILLQIEFSKIASSFER